MALKIPDSKAAIERNIRAFASSFDRYVDFGLRLHVVVRDPDGQELVPGAPKVRTVKTHNFGGMVDTKAAKPYICGPSRDPRVLYCSEDQMSVLLHRDDAKLGQLVYGSEGAGKTTVLAMWHLVRGVLPVIGEGKEGGQTAPTETRLAMIRQELLRICRPEWFHYTASEDLFTFCDGTRLRLVSSYRQSKAAGSPIQGFNWSWCGRDEGQDQIDVHEDIESRGRSAFAGKYHQLITATAKDDTDWRNLRDKLTASGLWQRRTMLGLRSPFVHPEFWEQKRATMDPREYKRRVEAQDVGVELAVYHCWNRERNLRKVGGINLTQAITSSYLPRFGGYWAAIAGHDPGNIYNTSTVSEYRLIDGRFKWVVVGELQTKQTTAGQHAAEFMRYLQRLGYEQDGKRVLIFGDPHGKGDTFTDYQTVYTAFHKVGLEMFSPSNERISRKARVGMVNRVLFDANSEPNLYVSVSDNGTPMAPELVRAFETMAKREGDDDPEGVTRKDDKDMTHAPASLGYQLWPFERELLTEKTRTMARQMAKHFGVNA
ncbi:MAG: hypothetical protein E6Q97_38520 [Desulfurellales bacterium]|nr:MAG: hypothetical protein E6Q97_38520 [Desulfurellales bacterium]